LIIFHSTKTYKVKANSGVVDKEFCLTTALAYNFHQMSMDLVSSYIKFHSFIVQYL